MQEKLTLNTLQVLYARNQLLKKVSLARYLKQGIVSQNRNSLNSMTIRLSHVFKEHEGTNKAL